MVILPTSSLPLAALDVKLLNVNSIVFFFKRTRMTRIYTNNNGFKFQDSCFKSRRNEGKCKSHYSRTCVLTCALCFESLYFIISFEPFKGLIPFPI